MAARKLTPTQHAVAVAIVAQGQGTVTEVAAALGVSTQAVRLRMPGLISATRPARLSDELKAAVAHDLRIGMSCKDVAKAHELGERTIRYLRKKLGFVTLKAAPRPIRAKKKQRRITVDFGNY